MIKINVDNREIEVEEGARLYHCINECGIYIPGLCSLKDMERPQASCRLCFVEIEGIDNPVLSCTVTAEEGMVIKTDTPCVRRLQRTAFELLLSVHRIECGECPANKKCELQKLAKFLKVPLKQKRIEYIEREIEIDDAHPYLKYDPNKCVTCGRCTYTCCRIQGKEYLSFAKRGLNINITFYGETDPGGIPCDTCYSCVDICPVGALTKKNS